MFSGILHGLLEGNGEIAAICPLEVQLHAIVQVTSVRLIFSSPVRNEFEGFPHAVFRHFLFCLPQLLEFASQNFKSLFDSRVFLRKIPALQI